jgi:hypothetical protein
MLESIPSPKISRNRRKAVLESLFQLKFVKNLENHVIVEQRDSFPEFWDNWFLYNKAGYTRNDFTKDEVIQYARKSINTLVKAFYRESNYKKRMQDIKRRRDMGATALDVVNQVVFSETKEDVTFDDDGKEVSRAVNKTITAKKIERIEFASEITIRAMEEITASQELADDWFSDYRKAIESANGGKEYTGKYNFHHLELAAKFKKIALDLADKHLEIISDGDMYQVKESEARMKAALKMSEMMEKVRESEFAPLEVMLKMHDAGMNRQKEMMAAINNDKQMIEFGNIVIKEDIKIVNRNEIRNKLKEHGYSKIQDLLLGELKAVGAVEDIEKEIENPIIETEEENVD